MKKTNNVSLHNAWNIWSLLFSFHIAVEGFISKCRYIFRVQRIKVECGQKLGTKTNVDSTYIHRRMSFKLLTDRFSISWQRWEPPFLGFCWNLVPCGLFGSYLDVKNIFGLSLPIWAWGHTLYFSLQCKTNPMFGIADFFQTQAIFIF